jgi:plastocyanin
MLTYLARIPADVSKRLLIILACTGALLTAAACSTIPEGEVNAGSGVRFTPYVADSLDDAGLGAQVTVDADGNPFISYLALTEELPAGQIAVTRPIGSPYIPAIGVTSLASDGIWTRGAAAQVKDTPPGITVPYGPATVPSLKDLTATNSNGTDIAVGADGSLHVVWTAPDGVWYAKGPDTFSAEQIYDYGFSLKQAGPIGSPSVAVDADGNPWVAYTANSSGQEVRVATTDGQKWTTDTAFSIPQCAGCPQPGPTKIGVTPDGPVVAFVDTSTGEVDVARASGGRWTVETVASDATGQGLDLAVDADGNPVVSYFTADNLEVAAWVPEGATWRTAVVAPAPAGLADAKGGNFTPTAGVAVDGAGTIYVTWAGDDGVALASGDGTTFTPVDTGIDTGDGAYPSVAVNADGSAVYVAWYDTVTKALMLGVQGDPGEIGIAQPSPAPSPGSAPSTGGAECGKDGKIALDIVASGTAFDTTCLVAPAGEPFTINFDNKDDAATTGPHNVAIATDSSYADFLFTGELISGPKQVEYKVDALDAGSYYFHCDVHPTMAGQFVVIQVKGAKK